MTQLELSEPNKSSRIDGMSREELAQRCLTLEDELRRVVRENYEFRNQKVTDTQLQFAIQEQLKSLQDALYGRSSERYKKRKPEDNQAPPPPPKPRVKKPSERYPNIPIRENRIEITPSPTCTCCGSVMTDSGMTETTEQLNVIPKKYEIILQKRVKYRCQCQGALVTAPAPPRMVPGSSYSDEMIQDIVISKYCDLIPMHRYTAMAARSGLMGLPAHSLIEASHQFADFVSGAYTQIKQGILSARVVHADETPHRMLEGSDKKSWYLWGFSTPEYCFLECRNTRASEVASEILTKSQCEVLISDVYSGYAKAVRTVNQLRSAHGKPIIQTAYCNAHARRYFYKAWEKYPEAEFYLNHFHEIYTLKEQEKNQAPPRVLELRTKMRPHFEAMQLQALEELPKYPEKGNYAKALRYFLNHYRGLTHFLNDPEVEIDNNSQERLLRNHVVGRKTWYGTHSERGALTAAILFSLIETCKLNQVNPREYIPALTQDLLAGKKPYTPIDFKRSTHGAV